MKKAIGALVVVATLGGMAGNASAVQIIGAGSCGEWVEAKPNLRFDLETWLLGYLSGLAVGANKDVLRGIDHKSIYLWMTNYCKANPLDRLGKGGGSLYLELVTRKGL